MLPRPQSTEEMGRFSMGKGGNGDKHKTWNGSTEISIAMQNDARVKKSHRKIRILKFD